MHLVGVVPEKIQSFVINTTDSKIILGLQRSSGFSHRETYTYM